jgi:2-amino-4-hydroxy-6-hydroxymethyldihydropteridine diphosphokinase
MKTVYLSLGSNIGDREQNITRAIDGLPGCGVRVARRSSLYATEPVDFRAQGWFLNCVVAGETDRMPRQLLHALRELERFIGRRRTVPRGPRGIDLDILFFGSSVVRAPDLEIPHPRIADRRFVLVPLCELAPALHHPVLNKTIAELLAATSDRSQVRRWSGQQASASAR